MSTIDTVIGKLETLITENHVAPKVENAVKEVLSLLKDRTVLLLEWNELDIQKVAREKLANMENCEEYEIIEKPLLRNDVVAVIDLLDKYYDCNYGITWETINSTLDSIALPDSELCLVKNNLVTEGFKCTDPDTNQWVKKLTQTNFLIYEKGSLENIELMDYTGQQLTEYISGYYTSLQEIYITYLEDANQIIAECIAESL